MINVFISNDFISAISLVLAVNAFVTALLLFDTIVLCGILPEMEGLSYSRQWMENVNGLERRVGHMAVRCYSTRLDDIWSRMTFTNRRPLMPMA